MSNERFEELVSDALDSVPDALMRLLDNVVILVADRPPNNEPILGVYEGFALTSRGTDYGGVLPDRIMIFRRPLLAMCHTEEQVVTEVRITVIHEIAHHFGIDDERLHELGGVRPSQRDRGCGRRVGGAVVGSSGHACRGYRPRSSARTGG